ncbi:MAG: T9SS type A sorting domain-containing protein [Ignavibacteriales bacterium]|nr:T9SS type A sorting domain-containing protein [Ignavibacteriales bacterium]
MPKAIILIFLLFAGIIFPQQLSKAYILSEGGFSTGSSKLGLYNASTKTYEQSIFAPGQLGLYPDGMLLYENNLYIIEQGSYGGSGKIYKVDTNGTVLKSALVGTNPYSLAIANGKVYITNGSISKVSILNVSDFSLMKELTVGVYPQEIIAFGNKVYVANTSLWGGASDSTISVINTVSDEVTAVITVRKDPSSLAVSNDGFLLVGCPGEPDYGKIYKVDTTTNTIVQSYSIPGYGFGKDIAVDKKSSKLYFIANTNDIVSYNMTNSTAAVIVPSAFPANSYYGYAFDYSGRNHFILDAKSYTVNGALSIHDSTGQKLSTFTTSIAPRRVLLKYSSDPSGVRNDAGHPVAFLLEQNYPNPFNPSTRINWQMPVSGHVKLSVYDILGKEVRVLVDEERPAGKNTEILHGEGLSSGIYTYRLMTAGFNVCRKMLLLK